MSDEMLEEKEKVSIRLDQDGSEARPPLEVSQVSSVSLNAAPDFDGRFEVIELIGEGGMGLVYKVRDPNLDKIFAVKVLRPALSRETQALKRFEGEASSAVGFDHPGLVAVYETGCLNDGTPFILMDYVDGSNLADVLTKVGSLSLENSLSVFEQIIDALEYVHDRGLTHRDVKPRNIILRTDDQGHMKIKLVDFGIAKIADSGEATTGGVTQTGDFLGSPLYMSPEQCQGRELTAQSDIYSAGCVFYEMLTGHSPFYSPNPVKVVIGHLTEPVAPIISIPSGEGDTNIWSGVNSMALKCLEKTTDKRYQTVTQIQKDLRALMESKNPFVLEKLPKLFWPVMLATLLFCFTFDGWRHAQLPDAAVPTFFVALFVTLLFQCIKKMPDWTKLTGILYFAVSVASSILMCSSYRDIPVLPFDSTLVAPIQIFLFVLAGLSLISTFKFALHPESFFSKPSNVYLEIKETESLKQRKFWFRFAILSTVLFAALFSKMPESQTILIAGGGALYAIAFAALSGGTLAIRQRLKKRESTLAGDRWLLLINGSVAVGLIFSAAGKAIAYLGSKFAISAIDASQWELVLNGLMLAALVLAAIFVSVYRKRVDSIGVIGKSDGW